MTESGPESAYEMVSREFRQHFLSEYGLCDEEYLARVSRRYCDDSSQNHRWQLLQEYLGAQWLQTATILDLASGCGNFVFQGLRAGYSVWGIEPGEWQHRFNRTKMRENNYPPRWAGHFLRAVGEALPFQNGSFSLIDSFVTLEHVRDVAGCLAEMDRVLKPGGVIRLYAPDYSASFIESHYRLPYLPGGGRWFFRYILKRAGRPERGLSHLQMITRRQLVGFFGPRGYQILDLNRRDARETLLRYLGIAPSWLIRLLLVWRALRHFRERPMHINLLMRKPQAV